MIDRGQRILVVRNDKLGDFMLSYPSFALLKHSLPEAEITALVPEYTRAMAEACPWIDQVIIDPGMDAPWREQFGLLKTIREQGFAAAITLFSTGRIGLALYLAHIPYRLAPATKLAQIFYNQRLSQRRSRSEKPEYAYNQDLVLSYLASRGIDTRSVSMPEGTDDFLPGFVRRPLLAYAEESIGSLRQNLLKRAGMEGCQRLVFIHPGSGGSANNLSVEQYAEIANGLESKSGLGIVITAGPAEQAIAEQLAGKISRYPTTVLMPQGGLDELAQYLQNADLFISGSTGPLHIAGALNRPTAAFFPQRRSATPLRWQTLNQPDRRLAFTPSEGDDMASVDLDAAITAINQKLLA